jgi:hypothetical protein
MARDLNELWGWVERLIARVSRLESGAFLENSSITKGRMRFIGGLLRLDSGALLELVGKADITGTLEGVGTILWRGSMKILGLGTLDVDGPATFRATLDVLAATRLRGKITLEDDMTLTGPGKIKVGTVTMGITSNGRPGLDFEGATLSENDDRLAMESGQAVVGVAPTFAAMAFEENSIIVTEDRVTIEGPVYLTGLPTISGVSGNLSIDPDTGQLGTS